MMQESTVQGVSRAESGATPNFIFLSGDAQPLRLAADDRRYTVIYPAAPERQLESLPCDR